MAPRRALVYKQQESASAHCAFLQTGLSFSEALNSRRPPVFPPHASWSHKTNKALCHFLRVDRKTCQEKSAFISGFYRVIAHRAVTFQAANDEPPLVRLPHTGFVRRIRARTSLTNAPPRLLVQTALAFRLRRSSRPARLPSANRKKSLASRKPAPLLTRTARLGRRTTRTCSSSPADYGADTYTR